MKIMMVFHGGGTANTYEIFDDWFQFADYCKQMNEAGLIVRILRWMYV